MFVVTATPHRISFFGGGTDLPEFYTRMHGAVLSVTINQFVYVTVKRHGELFGEPYRLNYSETERVDELDEIRNQIARETLRTLAVKPPIYISTVADMPSGSGLGSSSSFAVGLAQALNVMNERRMHPAELAELASHIEIDVLKKPIGKQDQYNAAIGGLNHFCFYPNGGVAVRAVRMPFEAIQNLFDHLMLMWTGSTRSADSVLREQQSNIQARLPELTAMRDAADAAVDLFESSSFSIEHFGRLLDEAWTLKRRLASSISNSTIDDAYTCARSEGAFGGKICGAGAGGFLLLCVPPGRRAAIRRALPSFTELNIGYEPHGSRVLFPQTHAASPQFVPEQVARVRKRAVGSVA